MNKRCLTKSYVSTQINELWSWYLRTSTSDYVKVNFFLGMLQRCEQSVVLFTVQNLKEMLHDLATKMTTTTSASTTGRIKTARSSARAIRFESQTTTTANTKTQVDDTDDSEIIYEAVTSSDDEFDDERIVRTRAVGRDENGNTYVDFIR